MPEDIITPSAEPAPAPEIPFNDVVEQVFGKDSPAEASPSPETPTPQVPQAGEKVGAPADERLSAKIAAGLRAEKRAAEARRADQERAANHQRELAAIEQRRAAVEADLKLAEQLRAAKASPSKALEMLGYQPKTFFETLASENEPAAVAQRAVSVEQAEREKLAAEVKALKEEREKERLAHEQARYQQNVHGLQQKFVEHVASSEAYPHLVAEFTAEEIAAQAWQLAKEHTPAYVKKFGEPPSDEVIAEHLESLARARAEKRAAWHAQIGRDVPKARAAEPGEQRASQSERGPSPRTLSSRQTGQRSAAPRPWSQEAADEESLRILRGAIK